MLRAAPSLLTLVLCGASAQPQASLAPGPWRAWLASPGGELPFGLELAPAADGGLAARVTNGPESIEVGRVAWDGERLELGFDHYAARIEARLQADGSLAGEWTKRQAGGATARLPFRATPGAAARFRAPDDAPGDASGPTAALGGRWAVAFESDPLPAVAELEQAPDGTLTGTFLTATGDWRWLAGDVRGSRLRLSAFDGAHAFLLDARLDDAGELRGDFWSRDAWHETWRARRDPAARPPDAFAQSRWDERVALADLVVADLEGVPRSLGEACFGARAVVLQLFGSWCPNCHDEGDLLAALERRYRARGLVVCGLAFELDPDPSANAEQVRRYAARHGCAYPFFLAGSAESKEASSRAFPALDRLRSYPTTVFLHGDGRVRAVHSGFAGPATGAAHEELVRSFEALIEECLAEPPPDDGPLWEALEAGTWIGDDGARYRFKRATGRACVLTPDGTQAALQRALVHGELVRVGSTLWRWDASAGALVAPGRLAPRALRRG